MPVLQMNPEGGLTWRRFFPGNELMHGPQSFIKVARTTGDIFHIPEWQGGDLIGDKLPRCKGKTVWKAGDRGSHTRITLP